jgi:hypothetical protein
MQPGHSADCGERDGQDGEIGNTEMSRFLGVGNMMNSFADRQRTIRLLPIDTDIRWVDNWIALGLDTFNRCDFC